MTLSILLTSNFSEFDARIRLSVLKFVPAVPVIILPIPSIIKLLSTQKELSVLVHVVRNDWILPIRFSLIVEFLSNQP